MGIINNMEDKKSAEEIRKRFKISEVEEQALDHAESANNIINIHSQNESGSFLLEEEESELLSSGEDDFGILKTESWLNQNDVINQVLKSPSKKNISSTQDLEGSFSSGHNQLDSSHEEPEKFIIQRGEGGNEANGLFGETVGNFLSQASMFSLTILM